MPTSPRGEWYPFGTILRRIRNVWKGRCGYRPLRKHLKLMTLPEGEGYGCRRKRSFLPAKNIPSASTIILPAEALPQALVNAAFRPRPYNSANFSMDELRLRQRVLREWLHIQFDSFIRIQNRHSLLLGNGSPVFSGLSTSPIQCIGVTHDFLNKLRAVRATSETRLFWPISSTVRLPLGRL